MKVGVYTPDKNWKRCKICGSYFNADKYTGCPKVHTLEQEEKR